MPQFFISSSRVRDDLCRIDGDEYHHLVRVRRVRTGEKILLRDENGVRYNCAVESVDDKGLLAKVLSREISPEKNPELTLCCCLLKGGNFEFVIQKAVELGTRRIFPVISERTISHPDNGEAKRDRWQRIAREAGKQCLRADIPDVMPLISMNDILKMPHNGIKIVAHTGGEFTFREIIKGNGPGPVTLLVGPEGGFSPVEVNAALSQGWNLCRFGMTQLRAETAAIALSAVVLNEMIEESNSHD